LSCSPCLKKQCLTREYEEKACLRRLHADDVIAAVRKRLAAGSDTAAGRDDLSLSCVQAAPSGE
jgi:hypothetical protein